MKRLSVLILSFLILLSSINVSAAKWLKDEYTLIKPPSEEYKYEVEFKVKLDDSFNGHWISAQTEKGVLNVKVNIHKDIWAKNTEGQTRHCSEYLFTFRNTAHFAMHKVNTQNVGASNGIYIIRQTVGRFDGTTIKDFYGEEDIKPVVFKFNLNDGIPEISVYLGHENNDTRVMSTVVKGYDITETGYNRRDELWNIDGTGDLNYGYFQQTLAPDEVDYSDLSTDPRRWDDPEKSIAAYGKYRDEEGVFHNVVTLKGTFKGQEIDYTTDFKAEFDISMPPGFVSTDDKVNVKYYRLLIYIDGIEKRERHLLKLTGNKGEKWFLGGDIQVRRLDSEVEWSPDEKLTDDRTIYMGFIELEEFDGNSYKHISGIENSLDLVFNFEDDSKTVMESITLKHDGRAMTKKLKDIKYEGGLVSYYVNMIYPNSLEQQMKKMGVAK